MSASHVLPLSYELLLPQPVHPEEEQRLVLVGQHIAVAGAQPLHQTARVGQRSVRRVRPLEELAVAVGHFLAEEAVLGRSLRVQVETVLVLAGHAVYEAVAVLRGPEAGSAGHKKEGKATGEASLYR